MRCFREITARSCRSSGFSKAKPFTQAECKPNLGICKSPEIKSPEIKSSNQKPIFFPSSKQRQGSGMCQVAGDHKYKHAGKATASTEITCLSPKTVKAVDLCSLHLLFIFFWKIEQVGDNLKQNDMSAHELWCVIYKRLTFEHEPHTRRKTNKVTTWHL